MRATKLHMILLSLLFLPAIGLELARAEWKYVEEKDPVSDKMKQFIYGTPSSVTGPVNNPYIRIGCYGPGEGIEGMGVTLSWGTPLKSLYPEAKINMVSVTTRFDSDTPANHGWSASDTFEFTYPPQAGAGALSQLTEEVLRTLFPDRTSINNAWTPKELHYSLLATDRAVFRAASLRGPEATLIFDMQGYVEAAKKLDSRCNPPGIADVSLPLPDDGPVAPGGVDLAKRKWADASKLRYFLDGTSYGEGEFKISDTTTIEITGMAWREGAYLIRAFDKTWKKPGLILYFLVSRGKAPIWLDGTVIPIYKFLGDGGIDINAALDYAAVFFFFVRADGPFLIVQRETDTYFPRLAQDSPDAAKMADAARKLKPLTCRITAERALCNATVYYADALFDTDFTIAKTGIIEMTDNTPLAEKLPRKIWAPIN